MQNFTRRAALAAVPALAVLPTMAGANVASSLHLEVSPHIAELLRQRAAAYAEYRRLSDADRPDDETDGPFDRWCELSEKIFSARAETWGDVLAQHRTSVEMSWDQGYGFFNMSRTEAKWLANLGNTIRRLAGAA